MRIIDSILKFFGLQRIRKVASSEPYIKRGTVAVDEPVVNPCAIAGIDAYIDSIRKAVADSVGFPPSKLRPGQCSCSFCESEPKREFKPIGKPVSVCWGSQSLTFQLESDDYPQRN